jgi:hypothetical protein
MSAPIESTKTIRAPLNFAASHHAIQQFSNFDSSLNKQSLVTHEVTIRDARRLATAPALDVEGFELHRLTFAGGDLTDQKWVNDVYGPRVGEYVRKLTGATHVIPFAGNSAIIRDTGKASPGRATAASFVHIDHTPESFESHLQNYCDNRSIEQYPRVKIFNVWRALSAPPQDVPLAICDQRTVDPDDWVRHVAVEPGLTTAYGGFTSLHNAGQRWHYFPDMTADEMLVFKAWDNGSGVPFGCLHGAFRNPHVPREAAPRVSAESRYFAFFER